MLIDASTDLFLIIRFEGGKDGVRDLCHDAKKSDWSEHSLVMQKIKLFFGRQLNVYLEQVVNNDINDTEGEEDWDGGDPNLSVKVEINVCIRKVQH